jgi:hypothetical protein
LRSKLETERRSAAAWRSISSSTLGGTRVVTDSRQKSSDMIASVVAVNVGNGGFGFNAPPAQSNG